MSPILSLDPGLAGSSDLAPARLSAPSPNASGRFIDAITSFHFDRAVSLDNGPEFAQVLP